MKKRVFFATLSALMLLAMIAVSVFPSFAADAVYYPNGTIILNEDLLNGAENFADNFSVNEDGEATYSWNEETGRVRVESTKNTVLDLEAIPEGLDYYTISADLYLTETTYTSGSVIFGMGINSGKAWSRSLYFQMNLPAGGADGRSRFLSTTMMRKERMSTAAVRLPNGFMRGATRPARARSTSPSRWAPSLSVCITMMWRCLR